MSSSAVNSDTLVGVAAASGAAILGLLSLKYNDRAVFTDRPNTEVFHSGAPLFGSLFDQINNKDRILEHMDYLINKHDTLTL